MRHPFRPLMVLELERQSAGFMTGTACLEKRKDVILLHTGWGPRLLNVRTLFKSLLNVKGCMEFPPSKGLFHR
jgi:hypothetical protein